MGDDKHCKTSYPPNGQQNIFPVLKNLYFKERVDGVGEGSRVVCSSS